MAEKAEDTMTAEEILMDMETLRDIPMSEIVEPVIDHISNLVEACNKGKLDFSNPAVVQSIEKLAESVNNLVAKAVKYAMENPDPVIEKDIVDCVNLLTATINALILAINSLSAKPGDPQAIEDFRIAARKVGEGIRTLVDSSTKSTPDKVADRVELLKGKIAEAASAAHEGDQKKVKELSAEIIQDEKNLAEIVELAADLTTSDPLREKLLESDKKLKEDTKSFVQEAVKESSEQTPQNKASTTRAEEGAIARLDEIKKLIKDVPQKYLDEAAGHAQTVNLAAKRIVPAAKERDNETVSSATKEMTQGVVDLVNANSKAIEFTTDIAKKKDLIEVNDAVKEALPKVVKASQKFMEANDNNSKKKMKEAIKEIEEGEKELSIALRKGFTEKQLSDPVDVDELNESIAKDASDLKTLVANLADAEKYNNEKYVVADAIKVAQKGMKAKNAYQEASEKTKDPEMKKEFAAKAKELGDGSKEVATNAKKFETSKTPAEKKEALHSTIVSAKKLESALSDSGVPLEEAQKTKIQEEVEKKEAEEARRKAEEELRKKREAEEKERKRKEEIERKRKEEEARKREEEIKRIKEKQARAKAMEEERKRVEEEQRKEEARKKKEEEERKKREEEERKERMRQLEEERKTKAEEEKKKVEEEKRLKEEERLMKEETERMRPKTTEETEDYIRKVAGELKLGNVDRANKQAVRDLMKTNMEAALQALEIVKAAEDYLKDVKDPKKRSDILDACARLRLAVQNLMDAAKAVALNPDDPVAAEALARAEAALKQELLNIAEITGIGKSDEVKDAINGFQVDASKGEAAVKKKRVYKLVGPLLPDRDPNEPLTDADLYEAIKNEQIRIRKFKEFIQKQMKAGKPLRIPRGVCEGASDMYSLSAAFAKTIDDPICKKDIIEAARNTKDKGVQLKILSTVQSTGIAHHMAGRINRQDIESINSCLNALNDMLDDISGGIRRAMLRKKLQKAVNQVIAMQNVASVFRNMLNT